MDRLIRAALGLGFLNVAILKMFPVVPAVPLLVFAIMLLITALYGWCPLYALFGLNSGRRNG